MILPKSISDPDIHLTLSPKSGKESGGKLRKTVSDRNAGIENDIRVSPIEVSFISGGRERIHP